jgi:hypothetical protein
MFSVHTDRPATRFAKYRGNVDMLWYQRLCYHEVKVAIILGIVSVRQMFHATVSQESTQGKAASKVDETLGGYASHRLMQPRVSWRNKSSDQPPSDGPWWRWLHGVELQSWAPSTRRQRRPDLTIQQEDASSKAAQSRILLRSCAPEKAETSSDTGNGRQSTVVRALFEWG